MADSGWVKLLLPAGEDGKRKHFDFEWQAPGLNEYTGAWTDRDCKDGLHITRREDLMHHLLLHDGACTDIAPVVSIPDDAKVHDNAELKKRKVSKVVLGEPVPIKAYLEQHAISRANTTLLYWAAAQGDIGLCDNLFAPVCDVHGLTRSDKVTGYAADYAAMNGRTGFIDWMISQGLDMATHSVSAYISASAGGSVVMIQHLSELGVTLDLERMFVVAAGSGRNNVISHLLQMGACPTNPKACDAAAFGNHVDTIRYLAKLGNNVARPGLIEECATVRHRDNVDTMRALLESGGHPAEVMTCAIRYDDGRLFDLAVAHGYDPTDPSVLRRAASWRAVSVIGRAVALGANPNDRECALDAVRTGLLDVLKCLEECGADTSSRELLYAAVRAQKGNIVDYLIGRHSLDDIELFRSALDACKIPLIEKIGAVCTFPKTAEEVERVVSMPRQHGLQVYDRMDAIRALAELGFDVTHENVVYRAAENGHYWVLDVLFKLGANRCNPRAMAVAKERGYTSIARELRNENDVAAA
jgi:hypothetical protein